MSGSRNGLDNSTVSISDHEHHPLFSPTPKTQQSLLVAEISARLLEWRDIHSLAAPPLEWLLRLSLLAQDNTDALWLYLSIQSGDLSALTNTYEEQAAPLHATKQSIQERHTRALSALQLHFPELHNTLVSLHHTFRPSRGRK